MPRPPASACRPSSIALHRLDGSRVWRLALSGFTLFDAAFGADTLLIGEAGNSRTGARPLLRSIDLDGRELWRAEDRVAARITAKDSSTWLVVGRFADTTTAVLDTITARSGAHVARVALGQVSRAAFLGGAKALLVARPDRTAQVVDVETGAPIWELR